LAEVELRKHLNAAIELLLFFQKKANYALHGVAPKLFILYTLDISKVLRVVNALAFAFVSNPFDN
jgi:hypothetical protein